MLSLDPVPDTAHRCPSCESPLETEDWYMPGMRCLVRLTCPDCARSYYGDLPTGHGRHYPCLLDVQTGTVHHDHEAQWFADWLSEAFANRTDEPVQVDVDERDSIERPLVLNCLDTLYGHSLLKLLNAQYHFKEDNTRDLVVVIPSHLEWCVPEGATAVWTVDLPFGRGTEWNDWLADWFQDRLTDYETVELSEALPHPHPADIDIDKFTGVEPFPLDNWKDPPEEPQITFIWRDDRTWSPTVHTPPLLRRLTGGVLWTGRKAGLEFEARYQRRQFVAVAERLRDRYPEAKFAVAGVGTTCRFPDWIIDERVSAPSATDERRLCRRYAQSHLVIGVHGSNMLLPSAHAATAIEIVPHDRWGNVVQDLLPRTTDRRHALFDTRLLPMESTPETVSEVADTMLANRANFGDLLQSPR